MKTIRYLSAGLLLTLSVLNIYLGIISRSHNSFVVYIVFGAGYFMLGMLLISKIRASIWFGLIIPLAILFIYPLFVDFKYLNPMSYGIMAAINAIVAIFCLILLLTKIKN